VPPFEERAASQLVVEAGKMKPGTQMRLAVDGLDEVGSPRSFIAVLTMPDGKDGAERLENAGLDFSVDGDLVLINNAGFDSAAEKAGLEFDQTITMLMAPQEQPYKQFMFIPALLLLALIWRIQRKRRDEDSGTVTTNPVEA
jgi:hypothetical protein